MRAIWVECCGHLSAFTIEDVEYLEDTGMVDRMWLLFSLRQRPKTMNVPLYRILRPGLKFFYEYDFGTTTRLTLGMVEERHGQVPEEGVRILARNYAPPYRCIHCQEKAQYIDTYEYTTYCDRHAREREDWPDRFLPLVNSPRTGNCAYTGPRPGSPTFLRSAILQTRRGIPACPGGRGRSPCAGFRVGSNNWIVPARISVV